MTMKIEPYSDEEIKKVESQLNEIDDRLYPYFDAIGDYNCGLNQDSKLQWNLSSGQIWHFLARILSQQDKLNSRDAEIAGLKERLATADRLLDNLFIKYMSGMLLRTKEREEIAAHLAGGK